MEGTEGSVRFSMRLLLPPLISHIQLLTFHYTVGSAGWEMLDSASPASFW